MDLAFAVLVCAHNSGANLEVSEWYTKWNNYRGLFVMKWKLYNEFKLLNYLLSYYSFQTFLTLFEKSHMYLYSFKLTHVICKCSEVGSPANSLPFASYISQQCVNEMQSIKTVCLWNREKNVHNNCVDGQYFMSSAFQETPLKKQKSSQGSFEKFLKPITPLQIHTHISVSITEWINGKCVQIK